MTSTLTSDIYGGKTRRTSVRSEPARRTADGTSLVPASPLTYRQRDVLVWRLRRLTARPKLLVAVILMLALPAGGWYGYQTYIGWNTARTAAAHAERVNNAWTARLQGQADAWLIAQQRIQETESGAAVAAMVDAREALTGALVTAQQVHAATAGKVTDETTRETLAAAIADGQASVEAPMNVTDAAYTSAQATTLNDAAQAVSAATQAAQASNDAWQQAVDSAAKAEAEQAARDKAARDKAAAEQAARDKAAADAAAATSKPNTSNPGTSKPSQPQAPPVSKPADGPKTITGSQTITCTGPAQVSWADSKATSVRITGAGSGSGSSSASATGSGAFTAEYTITIPAGTTSYSLDGWSWQGLAGGTSCRG